MSKSGGVSAGNESTRWNAASMIDSRKKLFMVALGRFRNQKQLNYSPASRGYYIDSVQGMTFCDNDQPSGKTRTSSHSLKQK